MGGAKFLDPKSGCPRLIDDFPKSFPHALCLSSWLQLYPVLPAPRGWIGGWVLAQNSGTYGYGYGLDGNGENKHRGELTFTLLKILLRDVEVRLALPGHFRQSSRRKGATFKGWLGGTRGDATVVVRRVRWRFLENVISRVIEFDILRLRAATSSLPLGFYFSFCNCVLFAVLSSVTQTRAPFWVTNCLSDTGRGNRPR